MPDDSRAKAWKIEGKMLTDERLSAVERLAKWAEDKGHTLLELAMSWLASEPLVGSVIAGATKPEQVAANAAAVGWQMSAEERAEAVDVAEGAA